MVLNSVHLSDWIEDILLQLTYGVAVCFGDSHTR